MKTLRFTVPPTLLAGGLQQGIGKLGLDLANISLPRKSASVAAVGSWFDLDAGIRPLILAR